VCARCASLLPVPSSQRLVVAITRAQNIAWRTRFSLCGGVHLRSRPSSGPSPTEAPRGRLCMHPQGGASLVRSERASHLATAARCDRDRASSCVSWANSIPASRIRTFVAGFDSAQPRERSNGFIRRTGCIAQDQADLHRRSEWQADLGGQPHKLRAEYAPSASRPSTHGTMARDRCPCHRLLRQRSQPEWAETPAFRARRLRRAANFAAR